MLFSFLLSLPVPSKESFVYKKAWNCNICFDMSLRKSKMKTKA
ncbi:hypothetical protein M071_1099 [Bacteroides fragilis str. Ds-233]|nr:hypothetical protein M071_1099 [Bacteroides fragilis str. Ds-233]